MNSDFYYWTKDAYNTDGSYQHYDCYNCAEYDDGEGNRWSDCGGYETWEYTDEYGNISGYDIDGCEWYYSADDSYDITECDYDNEGYGREFE